MMLVLLRGAVWAERRAVNLVHCAFHLSDDGKFFCRWSTCEVLAVIILIVNEAKIIWRSSKLSKEAVRGLMFFLIYLFCLCLQASHASPEQSYRNQFHWRVCSTLVCCIEAFGVNWGGEPPLIVFENLILITGEVYWPRKVFWLAGVGCWTEGGPPTKRGELDAKQLWDCRMQNRY